MDYPDLLWHYTDAAGLFGMITSGLLRFTDVRFLNDRTERTHGVNVVLESLDEAAEEDGPNSVTAGTRKHMDYAFGGYKHYVCSLSERNDSLSQWQRYAANGYGYCIAFDMTQLHLEGQSILMLYRMIYKAAEQKLSASNVVRRIRDLQIHANAKPEHERQGFFATSVAMGSVLLGQAALQLKNPVFEDEQEWRLLRQVRVPVLGMVTPNVQFAQRGNYVKPYLDVQLPLRKALSTRTLPIASVTIGPRLDSELAIATVQELLAASGYTVAAKSVVASTLQSSWR
jgi:hypothetical protein